MTIRNGHIVITDVRLLYAGKYVHLDCGSRRAEKSVFYFTVNLIILAGPERAFTGDYRQQFHVVYWRKTIVIAMHN
jgi:hypothetical protein